MTFAPVSLARGQHYSSTHLTLPEQLSFDDWLDIGRTLGKVEHAVSWWIGDWWAFGDHKYGDRKRAVEADDWDGPAFQACADCGSVARAFAETSRRRESLPFKHHREVAGLAPDIADKLLDEAERDGLPAMQVRARVRQRRAEDRLGELVAQALPTGDPTPILYADPPWQYENPPMGGSNRSIENHYPTLTLDEICALDIGACATADAVLFMWATAPKCAECFQVLEAWGFEYRTNIVWDKERIGMGYWARSRHELLLVARRGEMPTPAPADRPDSIIAAKRSNEHSEKPAVFYEMIERMYPGVRKREFFARNRRDGWEEPWGNQQIPLSAAAAE